jgi:hypothetical protein
MRFLSLMAGRASRSNGARPPALPTAGQDGRQATGTGLDPSFEEMATTINRLGASTE